MKLAMTTITMTISLLAISAVTTGIPLQDQTRTTLETLLGKGLSRTAIDRHTSQRQTKTLVDEQTMNDKGMGEIEYINGGRKSNASESERHAKTDLHFRDSLRENEKSQIPRRIRRTSRCRRQTDDELTELLRSTGQVNTRYADKSHHGFTSLISYTTNQELERATKLDIEAALRANQSKEGSLSHPHLSVIRSSLVTPEEVNVPRVRRSVVGTTVSNFCVTSGQELTQGYMRMCDSCAATTELSDDLFPRYLNEVVCSSNTECLSGGGQCSERTLSLTILRRTSHCSVASTTGPSGEVLFVEDWEPTTQRIRVACECDVNVQSMFAQYV